MGSSIKSTGVSTTYSLCHIDGRQYDYTPLEARGIVVVIAYLMRQCSRYECTREEAREHYRRQIQNGFEAF